MTPKEAAAGRMRATLEGVFHIATMKKIKNTLLGPGEFETRCGLITHSSLRASVHNSLGAICKDCMSALTRGTT